MNTDSHSTPHNPVSVPGHSYSVNDSRLGCDNQFFVHGYLSVLDAQELTATALALVNPRGKGIYDSDESPDAMTAILNTLAVVDDDDENQFCETNDKEKRRKWKEFAYKAIPSGRYLCFFQMIHLETHFLYNRLCFGSHSSYRNSHRLQTRTYTFREGNISRYSRKWSISSDTTFRTRVPSSRP
jgi:hypothetical protein